MIRTAVSPCLCIALLLGAAVAPAGAQTLSYTGCPTVSKADFTKVPVVTRGAHNIDEPIQITLSKDGRIFWVERRGLVRMWTPANNQATTLVNLTATVYTGTTNQIEHGVSGITLDPGFESNGWVYVFWAMKSPRSFRVSRYTLAANALGSEQPILEIPYTNLGCCHTGGSMAFDFAGNLWIAVGNTTDNNIGVGTKDPMTATNYVKEDQIHGDDQARAANTNSLSGKILRIKPKAIPTGTPVAETGAGKTYDIPAGNLFPLVGGQPQPKTRPEIYTMGHRNPYSLTLDPYRNWVTWGEIGPDEWAASDTVKTEEHNLVTVPGFMGWPYFVGKNQRFRMLKDPAKPMNTSPNNTGLTELPPAQGAIRPYGHSAAVTGPIYYYDGRLPSKTKLPPHFNKKWIWTDFNSGAIDVATVDEAGKALTATVNFWSGGFLVRPLDMEIGPDGNLYVVDYAGWFGPGADTRIARVEYRGTCLPEELIPPTVGLAAGATTGSPAQNARLLGLSAGMRLAFPEGSRAASIFDLGGRRIHALRSEPGSTGAAVPAGLREGVYLVRYLP